MEKHLNLKPKNKISFVKLISFVIIVVVVFITVSYSAVSDNLAISDMRAAIRVQKIIRVTGTGVVSTANGGSVSSLNYSFKSIEPDISLPNANSTVTLDIYITNLGNAEMGISEITGLPSNLTYSFTGYNLGAALCDSTDPTQCSLGSVSHFQMTIGYDENGYDGVTTSYSLDLGFVFHEMQYTARIGNHYYETIQAAINDSPTDGTETTIVLLKNVYQRIQIWRGNNIVLDMPNLVLHNKEFSPGSIGDPVVEIFGARDVAHPNSDNTNNVGSAILKMTNGSIITEANQGAINVERGGTFIMTGGSIICSGNRQAVYIRNGGVAQISGTSYLKASAELAPTASPPNYRATVHNVSGTLIITGGTFEADGNDGIALTSESTTTIGTEDGSVSTTVPTFIAKNTGIRINDNTTFNFYDGKVKAGNAAFYNESEVDAVETGYSILHSGEMVDGNMYQTAFLGTGGVTITFDPGDGTVSESTRLVAVGQPVGPLPTPTRTDYAFTGWYDANNNLMNDNSTISANTVFTAGWVLSDPSVAQIGATKYDTLPEALSHVPANTETTITILRDIELSSKITLSSSYDIVIDLNGHTINTTVGTIFENSGIIKIEDSATGGTLIGGMVKNNTQIVVIKNNNGGRVDLRSGTITSSASLVIENNGTMNITGGKITNDFDQGIINNNGTGIINMSGGEISTLSSGTRRQAIYNLGTVNISGTAVLTSASSDRGTLHNNASGAVINISGGTITSTNTNCQRGAIQNASGTVRITGGTVISNSNYSGTASGYGPSGIQNTGTLILGTQGGGIDTTNPVIRAVKPAILNTGNGKVDFYDGILQSQGTPFSGNYRNLEPNSTPNTSGTVTIGSVTYNTWYLESTS